LRRDYEKKYYELHYHPAPMLAIAQTKDELELLNLVLKLTQENIRDMDRDGIIDCCDYTIMFKSEWDTRAGIPCIAMQAENRHYGRIFNHMLIKVIFEDGTYKYIEPQNSTGSMKYWNYVMEKPETKAHVALERCWRPYIYSNERVGDE
jgi:hypothetical protein